MRRIARVVYVGAAWLALASVITLFFLAGMALFVRASLWETHIEYGWWTELPLLLLIVAGLAGWIPRRLVGWLVAISVLHVVHTSLPGLRGPAPLVAALHPATALALAWATLTHARRATEVLVRRGVPSGAHASR